MLESLLALAMVMRNDLDRFQDLIERPSVPAFSADELRKWMSKVRAESSRQVGFESQD
jgi:hypothetical protein